MFAIHLSLKGCCGYKMPPENGLEEGKSLAGEILKQLPLADKVSHLSWAGLALELVFSCWLLTTGKS